MSDACGGDARSADDGEFARPPGTDGGFAQRQVPAPYSPPPPTVSPQDSAVFGRPAGAESFAPVPDERVGPRLPQNPPVPRIFRDAFGAGDDARDGFAAPPGERINAAGPPPESPWWKADAARDPWRDPSAGFWLGRGAAFTSGRPYQIDPDHDVEQADDEQLAVPGGEEELEQPSNVRRVKFGLPTIALVALITLVAGGLGGGAGWFLTRTIDNALHRPDISIAKVETPVKRDPGSVAGVAKRVGPAVVSILIQTPDEFAIGSGVVIDDQGDILTNNHVVAPAVGSGSTSSIIVTFSDEATAKAQIVGRDPVSDLAVIRVPNDKLTVAQLGDSDKIAVGDPVLAIGSPLGLQGTVTEGIVSALQRPVHVSNDDGSSDAYLDAIQTDAAINPGNSGGALVNASGAVIGINSAGALGTIGPNGSGAAITGIGYAIPINYARDIAQQLIRTGKAVHASLGAQGSTAIAGLQVGGYVKQVSPGGPAAKAGLKPGDVIVAAGGTVVQTFDQLIVIVQQHKPGDKIEVEFYRNKSATKSRTTVTLG